MKAKKRILKKREIKKAPRIISHFASTTSFRKFLQKFTKKCVSRFDNYISKNAESKDVEKLNEGLEDVFSELEKYANKISRKFLNKMNKNIENHVSRGYRNAGFGAIETDKEINEITEANTYQQIFLIKSIPREILEKYQAYLFNNIQSFNAKALRDFALNVGKVSNKRAKFIARDQVAKAVNNYIVAKANQMGIEYYMWSTSNDERVSEDHKHLNNRIYRYDKPTAIIDNYKNIGHPGQRPNCRCVPVSIFLDANQKVVLRKDAKYGDYYEIEEIN